MLAHLRTSLRPPDWGISGPPIEVMTLNGARVLGEDARFGSVEAGKLADLIVIDGDPVRRPAEIRNVTLVFKEGVGYDAPALAESVKGIVGLR